MPTPPRQGERIVLKPGEYMDGHTVTRRCPSCGATLKGSRCPVSKKDCGR